jgi:hypothetical protein
MRARVPRRIVVGITVRAVMRPRIPSQTGLDKTANLSLRNEGRRIGLILRV